MCLLVVKRAQQQENSVQGHLKASGGVKKAKAKKGPGAKRRAKDLVDQFGCVNTYPHVALRNAIGAKKDGKAPQPLTLLRVFHQRIGGLKT